MGKVALLFAGLILSAGAAFAAELPAELTTTKTTAIFTMASPAKTEVCKAAASEKDELGRRGCCSWHSGVCGCSDGRVVCCDGSYSPSCTCHHDDYPENL